jgi:hypothetical protein
MLLVANTFALGLHSNPITLNKVWCFDIIDDPKLGSFVRIG